MEHGRDHGSDSKTLREQRSNGPAPHGHGDVVVIGAGIVGLCVGTRICRTGPQRGGPRPRTDRGGCAVGSAGHLVPSHVIPLAAPGALATAVDGLWRRNGALSVRWTTSPSFWRWIVGFARSCTSRSVQTAAPALGELASLSTEIWDDWIERRAPAVAADGLFDVYADRRAFEHAVEHAEELRRWGVAVQLLDGKQAADSRARPARASRRRSPATRRSQRSSRERPRRSHRKGRRVPVSSSCPRRGGRLRDRARSGDQRANDAGRRRRHRGGAGGRSMVRQGRPAARPTGADAPRPGPERHRGAPRVGPRRAMLLGEDHVAVGPMGDELRLSAWFQLNNFDTDPTLERIRPARDDRPPAAAPRRVAGRAATVGRAPSRHSRRCPDHRPVDALAQRDDRRRAWDDRPHARLRQPAASWPRSSAANRPPSHRPLLTREVLMNNTIALPTAR